MRYIKIEIFKSYKYNLFAYRVLEQTHIGKKFNMGQFDIFIAGNAKLQSISFPSYQEQDIYRIFYVRGNNTEHNFDWVAIPEESIDLLINAIEEYNKAHSQKEDFEKDSSIIIG